MCNNRYTLIKIDLLFTSIEAIAFATVGYIFGKEVIKTQAKQTAGNDKYKELNNLSNQVPNE